MLEDEMVKSGEEQVKVRSEDLNFLQGMTKEETICKVTYSTIVSLKSNDAPEPGAQLCNFTLIKSLEDVNLQNSSLCIDPKVALPSQSSFSCEPLLTYTKTSIMTLPSDEAKAMSVHTPDISNIAFPES
ncbi:uncharacterized protein LOC143253191 [Tachypleus tridentatus]|uniref:uncharacterized protein LOC143253191 n=1 Tax=Tachypleus tridentatus TaxID=6853 RepID=UPI003FD0FF7F